MDATPFTEQEMLEIRLGQLSFVYFLKTIFPKSFENNVFMMSDGLRHPFQLGQVHYDWAGLAQIHSRLCVMSPRGHLKSTILNQAFSFWQLFKANEFVDGITFGFKEDRAWDHLKLTKRLIRRNPYTRFWRDVNPRSPGIHYICGFGDGHEWEGLVDAAGIFSAQRGRHPRFVICDDILPSLADQADSTVLRRIDVIFNQVIASLPEIDLPLIVVGTPQSYEDTLFKLYQNPEYYWGRFPAETRIFTGDTQDHSTLWPEKYDWKRLKRVERSVRQTAYQVEYLLIPFLAANAFIPQEALEMCVDSSLEPYQLDKPFNNPHHLPVYLGMDVGRDIHPSHLSVGIEMPDRTLVQIHQIFLDGTPYDQQAKYVNLIYKHFGVNRGYYDATRAELDDRGMNKRIKPMKITKQKKGRIALILEKRIYAGADEPGIIFLQDSRQLKSMVAVDKRLDATSTDGGHGDAFWSNALMCTAAEEGPGVVFLEGGVNEMFAVRPDMRGLVAK